jgi:hypothetical protein
MDDRITDQPPPSQDGITDQPPGTETWGDVLPWGEVPLWERPGGFRLDVKPHRGTWLLRLGQMAFLVWPLALVGSAKDGHHVLPVLCAPPALVALFLGLLTWWLARRDLKRMLRGSMDPAGASETTEAQELGGAAARLGAIGLTMALIWCVLSAVRGR